VGHAARAGRQRRGLVYSAAIATSVTAFRVLRWDVRVSGTEHVPTSGGAILATNHVGYLDFVFAGYAALQRGGRRVRFVAKREVFDHRVVGPLMRAMGHIPVDRGGNTASAMTAVADALAAGDLVGMFPEGTVNTSFVPLHGRSGAARMAVRSGVPLIPAAVWGTQRISTKGRRPTPAPGIAVTVDIGPAVPYGPDDDPREVHERRMAAIGSLVDAAQRAYPQHPRGPDDTWWLPAHLGGSAPTVEEAERRAQRDRDARRGRT
jgi:1-acyl-sn-glycerol-3-phosphate acyltransferase